MSSNFYETAITAPTGGVYSLVYAAPDNSASLVIYQQADSGPDLVAQSGSTAETVVDGFPASYFEGGWRAYNGTVTWTDHDAQTLIFEPHGVRVMIHYSGLRIDPLELLSIADSMNFI